MNIGTQQIDVAIVGGGPAGLMAAEAASALGARVVVFDAMPSVGRKFLLAGKGGLNLTHDEPLPAFLARYEAGQGRLRPLIKEYPPSALRAFAAELGIETFVGTSGRVFPRDMKSAPLLRRWLQRLRARGVVLLMRHRWLGWNAAGALTFEHAGEVVTLTATTTVLAMGGGSWPQLGSDAAWVAPLATAGIAITPLVPANCGFDCRWSDFFREHHAGTPLKSVAARCVGDDSQTAPRRGEFVITDTGVEGSLIYALASRLRRAIETHGYADLELDLAPAVPLEALQRALAIGAGGKRTVAEQLRRGAAITGVKSALLREVLPRASFDNPMVLAAAIKSLPVRLNTPRPLAEAISTAGGVALGEVDQNLMIKRRPGIYCAGEMLDWEAPTGGYLLSACFATGARAGRAAATQALVAPAASDKTPPNLAP